MRYKALLSKITIAIFFIITNLHTQCDKQLIASHTDQYFAHNNYQHLCYSEDCLKHIKQQLLSCKNTEFISHQELKTEIKTAIKNLQQKKFRTIKWLRKNNKNIQRTLQHRIEKQADTITPLSLYNYLRSSKHPTCKSLQGIMQQSDILPQIVHHAAQQIIQHELQKL